MDAVTQTACRFWAGGTVECRGDGYMWDADHDGYDPEDLSMPCPQCNTKVFLEDAKEESECCSYFSGMTGHGTGDTIWNNAVRAALSINREAAIQALLEIREVNTLASSPHEDMDSDVTTTYIYASPEDIERLHP